MDAMLERVILFLDEACGDLTPTHTCSHLLTSPHTCSHLLTPAHTSSHLLTPPRPFPHQVRGVPVLLSMLVLILKFLDPATVADETAEPLPANRYELYRMATRLAITTKGDAATSSGRMAQLPLVGETSAGLSGKEHSSGASGKLSTGDSSGKHSTPLTLDGSGKLFSPSPKRKVRRPSLVPRATKVVLMNRMLRRIAAANQLANGRREFTSEEVAQVPNLPRISHKTSPAPPA